MRKRMVILTVSLLALVILPNLQSPTQAQWYDPYYYDPYYYGDYYYEEWYYDEYYYDPYYYEPPVVVYDYGPPVVYVGGFGCL